MATFGVEQIEMGDAAKAVMDKTNSVTKRIEADSQQTKRKSLDLSAWNINEVDFDADVEDIFSLSSDGTGIANKTGDALYRAAAKLCNAQLPECKSQSKMMELMYTQRVRSDCTAYENSLRQQRTQSAQKLATAQSAMREAALEQYRNANKYDLGQCTVQFKQCMQTTGGCGDDFTGCVEYAVRDSLVNANSNSKPKEKTIKGSSSKITLLASTYEALESKKELCMSVTQQCVNVRDQVWDTFLREVAPQVKSAELIVESNKRMSCISTISNCFQKACKENMDPNDPDGSYDMCLTNPETLRKTCKVEIDPCEGAIPDIMTYVTARLASMRVDSCTREFKECLTSEDRCGKDYTQCVGLDTDTIVDMCPTDKLVACQYKDGAGGTTRDKTAIRENLEQIATGIFLNIDNNLLATCQKAVQSKVLEVCGSLSECDAFADDDVIGTDSLISYKNSAGDTVIEGLMNFGLLEIKSDATGVDKRNYTALFQTNGSLKPEVSNNQTAQRIASSINTVANKVKQKLDVIGTDLTIDRCVNGRDNKWRGKTNDASDASKRFPHLLDSYKLMVFNSALDKAYLNYRTKYDELVGKALEDQNDDVKSLMCASLSYDAKSIYCDEPTNDEGGCNHYTVNGALSERVEKMYAQTGTYGLSNDGLSYVIRGADLATKLGAISDTGAEYVQTDGNNNMVGIIAIKSFYSPGTNVCTVTTTTTMCSSMREKMTSETDNTTNKTRTGVVPFGIYGNNTYERVKTKEFDGVFCDDFMEPRVETTEIKM